MNNWDQGHVLSASERTEFWNTEVLRGFCFAPGFEKPGHGATSFGAVSAFNIIEDGNLYEVRNSVIEPVDRSCVIYCGPLETVSISDLVAEHLINLNSQFAFAIKFHGVDENFAEYSEVFHGLRDIFWIDFGDLSNSDLKAIDQNLSQRNDRYQLFTKFLKQPFAPQFRGALEAMVNQAEFTEFL